MRGLQQQLQDDVTSAVMMRPAWWHSYSHTYTIIAYMPIRYLAGSVPTVLSKFSCLWCPL